jgi:hypothetical protein
VYKLFLYLSLFLLFVWLGKVAYNWESPSLNLNCKKSIYDSIYGKEHLTLKINSMSSEFDVNYVANAATDCVNPYFPDIHIATASHHTGWIHIVHTDAADPRWQKFIDSTVPPDETYPLYTSSPDFYDSPHWNYKLFQKPLSFWKGHAYAVRVDDDQKTVHCVGGIEWGFELPYWSLRPHCLTPRALTRDHWTKDWILLENAFQGYTRLSY